MKKIVDGVIANEMGALQYEMFEDINTQEICFVEKYHASFSCKAVFWRLMCGTDMQMELLKSFTRIRHTSQSLLELL